jgi:hypothetical protein
VILSRGCEAAEALDWTRGVMPRIGLTLNEAKTSIKQARRERFDFLGYLQAASPSEEWHRVSCGESIEEERFQVAAESGRPAGAPERGTVAGGARSAQDFARLVELLCSWDAADGLPRGRSLCLRARTVVPPAPPQAVIKRLHHILGCARIREIGRPAVARCAAWAPSVSWR